MSIFQDRRYHRCYAPAEILEAKDHLIVYFTDSTTGIEINYTMPEHGDCLTCKATVLSRYGDTYNIEIGDWGQRVITLAPHNVIELCEENPSLRYCTAAELEGARLNQKDTGAFLYGFWCFHWGMLFLDMDCGATLPPGARATAFRLLSVEVVAGPATRLTLEMPDGTQLQVTEPSTARYALAAEKLQEACELSFTTFPDQP